MKKFSPITLSAVVCVILFTLFMYYSDAGFLDSFEARTYDLRFKLIRGPIEHDPNIVIAAIDEKSLAELGRYPWSREVYAPFLDNLKAAGAKAVIFDAFFPEEQNAKADGAFARAIERSGNVTLAAVVDLAGNEDIPDLIISIPMLTDAAKNTAHINALPDEDGVNRYNLLITTYYNEETEEEYFFPSLGLMAAIESMDLGLEDISPSEDGLYIIAGDREIPVVMAFTEEGVPLPFMLINYSGPPGTYERLSFVDVMKGRIEPDALKDKIVFFGATALGVYDMRESPFHPNTPGVEMHANIADTIIRGEFIEKSGIETLLDIFSIIALSLTAWFITIKFKPIVALPSVGVILIGYFIYVSTMFSAGSWVSMVYPMLSISLCYALTGYLRFILMEKKARHMRSMFSSYVSRKVVDELAANPETAKIGGDKKDITILFSDIKGYTSYSEKREPEVVVNTLNQYLGEMSSVIIDNDGTLDKFLGDGIMAYWGAPLPQANHHEMAIRCTLDMLKALKRLHVKWEAEGIEPFSIRVGLNSGKVIAGNVGAAGKKMEYTVIGDNVNLASRLEASAKVYGITVLVSESTYTPVKDLFLFRELDNIRVVGKTQPIRIYELLGERTDAAMVDLAERFESGVTLYRDRNFVEAKSIFSSLAEESPDDPPCRVYIERCESFIQTPPPVDWDGVFVRTSK